MGKLSGLQFLLLLFLKQSLWFLTFLLLSLFINNIFTNVLVELLLQHVRILLLFLFVVGIDVLTRYLISIVDVSWDFLVGLIEHEEWLRNTTLHSADGLYALTILFTGQIILDKVFFEILKRLQLLFIRINICIVELELRILLQLFFYKILLNLLLDITLKLFLDVALRFGGGPAGTIWGVVPISLWFLGLDWHKWIESIWFLLLILFVIHLILSLDRINLALIDTLLDQFEVMVDDLFNV